MDVTKQAWKASFGIYRAASRVLLYDGAIETARRAVSSMRAISGNWDIPRRGFDSKWTARNTRQLSGPYNSGRAFLRRI